ncbi:hypothetical protein BGX21_007103 [Mortierella sp. AD011]|nr:hypothetical protein BGX20_000635 [Mortierella sp. AD010]KAF9403092.1 hypothetical protein BGX21_007103 [Mortierella sp. AD011]
MTILLQAFNNSNNLLLATKILAASSMGILAGSAVNYNAIIMPSLKQLASSSSLSVWAAMYARAKPFQVLHITVSFFGASLLYYKTKDPYYLAGALLTAGVIPYNKLFVYSVNKKLLEFRKSSRDDDKIEEMLTQWHSLHFGRTLMSCAALILTLYAELRGYQIRATF